MRAGHESNQVNRKKEYVGIPLNEISGDSVTAATLKRIRYRRKLIHDFRSRFREEYFGQLCRKRLGKPDYDFKIGDVMMIEEPSKKRVY
ncbi:hypothetical protein TNCV_1838221 [Trichonephila clavipes]|nr:hypothetical protein TNCV_1838221 [Trichonephila clavipes]